MSNPAVYTVGWICAIHREYVAAQAFLDEQHEGPKCVSVHDSNDYTLGKIWKHNVVIAVLPDGEYGTDSAASVATNMLNSFPNVRIGLMVGIGGGAPNAHDIRLGDVVVSSPRAGDGGVFQYDFGKTIQCQEFQHTRFLNQPPTVLRTAVSGLKSWYEAKGHQLEDTINGVLEKSQRLRKKYKRPEPSSDRLFKAEITHDSVCTTVCNDSPSNLIVRRERTEDEDNPTIHYGLIASANQLMKDASIRDKLAAEKDVLCFEMEAAGLMNRFPCLVIRGICDYSDSHKNEEWQGYAAMVAAAYTKDLLHRIPPTRVEAERKIADIIFEVRERVENLLEGVNKLVYRQEDEAILNWLTPVDYSPQHNNFINQRQPRTGRWLLDSDEFRAWLDRDEQTLFCPGVPGAGKTIIAATVIEHLQLKFQGDRTTGIAYIYCEFARQDEQNANDLLASLLKQLSQKPSSLPMSVKNLYDQHKDNRTRPSFRDISEGLRSVAAMYSRVFIIIDALDECPAAHECWTGFLSEIFKLQANTGANLFTTSRPIQGIKEKFVGSISLEIVARPEDVEKYLDGHMSQLPLLTEENRDLSEEDKEKIKNEIKLKIIGAVNGVFLLARFHLESLTDKTTRNLITEALKTLPKGDGALADAYGETIKRITSQKQGLRLLAEKVLLLLTCAERLLTTWELREALAVKSGASTLDRKDLESTSIVVSVCMGLVTVDRDSDIIRLVHHTTREYLATHISYISSREDPATLGDPTIFNTQKNDDAMADVQKTITIICVTYLSFDVFESGFCRTDEALEQRLRSYPLYDYAARNWGHHARKCSEPSREVISFLEGTAKVEASSQQMLAVKQYSSHSDYSQTVPRNMTGLHLAGYFGLAKAIETLLNNGSGVNSTDSTGRTPLSWAATSGYEAVVELLLEKGAQPDLKDEDNHTPLSRVIEGQKTAMVKVLLENGAKTDYHYKLCRSMLSFEESFLRFASREDFSRTPLSRAAERGDETIVRYLLDYHAQPDLKDEDDQTPLSRAIEGQKAVVVKMLLENSANVDYRYQRLLNCSERSFLFEDIFNKGMLEIYLGEPKRLLSRTPLSRAVEIGDEKIVEHLLDHHAQADYKDEDGQTPLSRAIEGRKAAVVKLLLQKDIKVDYRYQLVSFGSGLGTAGLRFQKSTTPLSRAAEIGDKTIVELLLEHHAKVDYDDGIGQTPLSRARWEGKAAVVELLLKNGAKPDRCFSGLDSPGDDEGDGGCLSLGDGEEHESIAVQARKRLRLR